MLYNANQKKNFIKACDKSDLTAKEYERIFKRIGDIEERYGTDMCFIDDKEKLLEMIGYGIASNRSTGTGWKLKMLQKYVTWCAERLEGVQNLIFEINIEDINSVYIKDHMVSDPEDLRQYMNLFLAPDEDQTMDIVLKCVMWMAYAGAPAEIILEIENDDVDLTLLDEQFLISKDGHDYPVPAIAHETFYLCKTLDVFHRINVRYSKNYALEYRVGGNKLLRGVVTVAPEPRVLIQRIQAKASKKGVTRSVNYTGLMWSGFYYRLNKGEKAGKPINFEHEAMDLIGDKEYKLDKSPVTQRGMRLRISREIETDYNLWKKTFNK